METIEIGKAGRTIRERPGRVRWRRLKPSDHKYQPLAENRKDEEFVLEQEWIIETFSDEFAVWGPPETEWREVPTEDDESA